MARTKLASFYEKVLCIFMSSSSDLLLFFMSCIQRHKLSLFQAILYNVQQPWNIQTVFPSGAGKVYSVSIIKDLDPLS